MARTYSSTPVLSKIKIGESTYYLKDADARAILDGINADVYESLKLALGTVAGGGDNFVTAGAVKSYVDEIAELGFDVVKIAELPTANAQAYETYHNRIVLVEDEDAASGACIEYIIMRSGSVGSYTYAWEKIGSTKADLSDYVSDVKYLAGTHKLQQKKGGSYTDVHTFGPMADVSQAETTLNDYVTGVSSAKVTAVGSINTISVYDDSTGTLPSFEEGAFTANKPTTLDLSKFKGGSKAADTFDAGSLPSKAADTFEAGSLPSFSAGAFSQGTLPSFSEGAFTPASLVTETKALYKQGVKAEVGSGVDAETLIFTNVEKEADIKVVSTFDGGSKAADTWSAGTLPTKAADTFDAGALPSFSEGAFSAGVLPSFSEGAFTPAALESGFYSVGTSASKVADTWAAGSFPTTKSQAMTFTGSEVDVSVSLAKGNKTITVDPKTAA